MRDLQKDLEICNRATPGPWKCLDDTPVDPEWADIFPQDLDFVMESREGWPHAIERAIKAEAEVERLRAEVNSYNTTLGETISECAANIMQVQAELKIYKKALEYACQDLDVKGIAFNRLPINQVMEWYIMKAATDSINLEESER